jgi:hypothetical protein
MTSSDKPQVCLTPGSVYSVGANHEGVVFLTVTLPRSVARERVRQYIFGHFGVVADGESDAAKLRRYEQMYAARNQINKAFHDALEPVIGDLYRTIWPLAIAGRTIDGEIMPDTYDEYLTCGTADKLLHLLKNAPRDGTYIEVNTGRARIMNVYWCEEASAWAQDGRTFHPKFAETATWRLMERSASTIRESNI